MKSLLALALFVFSASAFAHGPGTDPDLPVPETKEPVFNKMIVGTVSIFNLPDTKDEIFTSVYIGGQAAKEIYKNLAVKEMIMADEYGDATGTIKIGKNVICKEVGSRIYQCNIHFNGKTGAAK